MGGSRRSLCKSLGPSVSTSATVIHGQPWRAALQLPVRNRYGLKELHDDVSEYLDEMCDKKGWRGGSRYTTNEISRKSPFRYRMRSENRRNVFLFIRSVQRLIF